MLDKYFTREEPAVALVSKCCEGCKVCSLGSTLKTGWAGLLRGEFSKGYFAGIMSHLHKAGEFFPPPSLVFNALNLCPLHETRVVIIGQDPYHNPGQAMGLSFSVPRGVRVPPSLRNIYEELESDIPGFRAPDHGDLRGWASQGVLLLNDTLTVARNQPASHSKVGWKSFTTRILELVNERQSNVVFMLWGSHAREKAAMVSRARHLVLQAGHPSPFSAKLFMGCRHFSKANAYLKAHGRGEIDWSAL